MSVSHDLRTPLTSIRGFVEAIADGATDDPARSAEVIRSEAARLNGWCAICSNWQNSASSCSTLERRRLDVSSVVTDIAAGQLWSTAGLPNCD